MSELTQFLEGDGVEKVDILEQPLEPEKEIEEVKEDDEVEARNRRERRLQAKYQAERESSIALAARLEALTESQKFRQEAEPTEYLKGIERIYGTATPETLEATEILKKAMLGLKDDAKREAIEEFEERQRKQQEAVATEERELDSMLEQIEDTHGVTLSETSKKGFYSLLQKMSPKDADGNVVAYADPEAVWEVYSSNAKKTDNRAKDLSARSMVQSGASTDSTLVNDSHARFLSQEGII